MEDVRVIRAAERSEEATPTPGMRREQAVAAERLWSGVAHTGPGMASGWHHHGDHETSVYVVSGRLRMESGPGGSRSVEASPGDFVLIPPGVVHRESNPSDEESLLVLTRVGDGPTVVNVDGPP